MAKKVSFGLTLPNRGVVLGITTVREMLDLSAEAEKSGVFDSIWAGDSLAAKPRLEAITLLSAVAARTERVKLGPACFASFPLRHPILLAYQWASFDVVSEGRAIMVACQGARGTGSGDSETEWAAMGLDLAERAHRMEEGIDILRKLWSGKNVSHQGRFYQFKDLTIEPQPVQNPCPIWIANNPHIFGASEKLLNHIARRVARMADGWQTTFTTPEAFKLGWERIVRQAKEIGRDVSNMPRCLYYNCHINEDRDAALHESKEFLDAYYTADWTPQQLNLWVAMGSPQECIKTIQSHVEAGADIITIRFPARNQTRQFDRFVNESRACVPITFALTQLRHQAYSHTGRATRPSICSKEDHIMGAAENKQLIQNMFAELSKGNAEAFLGNMADNVRFTLIGTTKYSGTFNGKQELISKLLAPLTAQLEGGISLTPDNFIADGEYVAMQARGKATTKSGKSYNNTYCQVFRIVNGKVQEVTEYLDTELVTSAFGK